MGRLHMVQAPCKAPASLAELHAKEPFRRSVIVGFAGWTVMVCEL